MRNALLACLSLVALFSGNLLADEPETVLDCSPPRAAGFNAAEEKIYLHNDGLLAVYQVFRGNSKPIYQLAFGTGLETVQVESKATRRWKKKTTESRVVPDGVYLGIISKDMQMQITFDASSEMIQFSRSVDSTPETYRCRPEKRVSVDWEQVTQALAGYNETGMTVL